MILNEPIRLFFILLSVLLIFLLIFLTTLMYKKNNDYRRILTWPISIGIFSIICYCFFLLVDSHHHFQAVLMDSLFFIGTDWLALCMFLFSIEYTGGMAKKERFLHVFFTLLCALDSVQLFVNNFTHHMFDLDLINNVTIQYYWANDFYFWHYVHLGLCYAMVGLTFVNFAMVTFSSSKMYRSKYTGIFISYFFVIIVNCICYSLNLPIDASVILYGVLAGFICYYTTYTFPHQLLNHTLLSINETIDDALLHFDYEGNCIYVNKIAKQIFSDENGYNQQMAEKYREKREEYLSADEENNVLTDSFEIDGKMHYYQSDYFREYIDDQIVGFSIKMIDVTTEVLSLKKEEYIINHDELTGIYNRNGFLQKVDEYTKIHGTSDYYMITSDIKDFKLINQLFGEKVGDEVLIREAIVLKEASHYDTIYGRIGDDNFGLFTKKEFFTKERFDRFIKRVAQITESSIYHMYVYVGIYDPQGRSEAAQVMVDKANLAISQIKNDLNQVYAFYDSNIMDQILNEKNIKADFEDAISSRQFEMYLQPIIDVNNKNVGAEALCRWQHPLRGLLLPSDFLSILEKSGLIYQLDEYVWELAAKKLHEWSEKGKGDTYIAVNISEKDFFFTDIYKTFTKLVEEYDINPQLLHLEITESVLMSDFDRAHKLLSKLRNFGFIITIDNFGSGFSSLNMLKDINPQVIKIDMALLEDIEINDKNRIILETIIEMSHALGIKVVGQGVENEKQYEVLKQFGCSIFQGNSLAQALSEDEYEANFKQ